MLVRKRVFATDRICGPMDYESVKGMAADLRLCTFGLVKGGFRVPDSCHRSDALAGGMWPICGLDLGRRSTDTPKTSDASMV
jgi:hypothetical protein